MLVEFVANEAGSSETGDRVQSVGVSSGDEYLLFSRAPPELEDRGICLEYRDQINSGYESVRSCTVSTEQLEVVLSRNLGNLRDVEGFRVKLALSPVEHEHLVRCLKAVFRGEQHVLLHIEA